MKHHALNKAFHEAHRFLEALQKLKDTQPQAASPDWMNGSFMSGHYTAAVRRASMDLTRALSELRKS